MDTPCTTVLIIDDEPALRMGLAAKVRRHGYEVVTACDGIDGMQKARDARPDLIISDVMMPPPNGFELRRLMAQDRQLASIPFIFLTARTSLDDRVTGIRDGADDYITKPFETEELLARMEAVLRRVRLERERVRAQMQEAAQQEMERLKREILQNFRHEMQTPLNNIAMPLELVVRNKFEDPEEQMSFIRMALSSVGRLESLVADFVLLTNIDQGNLNLIRQTITVKDHILVPAQKQLQRYQGKGLQFTCEIQGSGEIRAPRREFTQSIIHLLDNAFKFCPAHGKVQLMVSIDTNGGVVISIVNDGPCIPVGLREKIFERYYQVSQGDSREHDGLGVGLFIARAVFRSLGGDVSILESDAGCLVQAVLPNIRSEDICYG